jgi:cytochrome c-type biogenesis protein CcmH
MTGFIFAAAAIVVVALLLLMLPRRYVQTSHAAITASIYRDQLAELDRDLASGQLAEADYQTARAEVQRRLLEDIAQDDAASRSTMSVHSGRSTRIALLIALPVLGAGLYAWLGNPAALDPAQRGQFTHQDIERIVSDLAAKMEQRPDDLKGWAMLAQSYIMMGRSEEAERAVSRLAAGLEKKPEDLQGRAMLAQLYETMGRYEEAERTYEKAWSLVEKEPQLLTSYAALLVVRTGTFAGRPEKLINRALILDPDNALALWLAGTAAFDRGDYASAIAHWQRAQQQVPPESEDSQRLASSIEEAQQRQMSDDPKVKATPEIQAATSAAGVRGRVELTFALKDTSPDDTVFIIIKEAGGPAMPLAIKSMRVADLPADFSFSNANDALVSSRPLSSAKSLQIEARVSKRGDVKQQSGDLISDTVMAKPGAKNVRLVIDKVLK